jgi:hypothetical protein
MPCVILVNRWRKNAKDTSVVAIGEKTHKVLKCEHVAKTDDLVTQKNEKIGTERIYSYFSLLSHNAMCHSG